MQHSNPAHDCGVGGRIGSDPVRHVTTWKMSHAQDQLMALRYLRLPLPPFCRSGDRRAETTSSAGAKLKSSRFMLAGELLFGHRLSDEAKDTFVQALWRPETRHCTTSR